MCVLQVPDGPAVSLGSPVDSEHYEVSRACVEELALYLKPISGGKGKRIVCVSFGVHLLSCYTHLV